MLRAQTHAPHLHPEAECEALAAAQSVNQKAAIYSDFLRVELAGLEPATSWVRSRRSPN